MKISLAKELSLSLSTESGIEASFTKSNSMHSGSLSSIIFGWCASTPLFFDDVYERGTRGKKQQVVANQTGRSLIEMLGVLAIIGVLSVGGIAGYSKAMMKFKVNKTVDQVSTIVANTRTLFASQKKYTGLDNNSAAGATLAKKAHLFPDEMVTGSAGNMHDFENAFGGGTWLQYSGKVTDGDSKAFTLLMSDIPEEACMELATMDWGSGSSSGLIAVGRWVSYTLINCDGQDNIDAKACPNGKNVAVPMPVNVAVKICGSNPTDNILMWKFY